MFHYEKVIYNYDGEELNGTSELLVWPDVSNFLDENINTTYKNLTETFVDFKRRKV
jgi:GH15 family glucan-1,4-alpha-glucosidase